MRNPKWSRPEMEALIRVYRQHHGRTGEEVDHDLLILSNELLMRAEALGIKHDHRFRNLAGVKMQYQCLRYLDSDGKVGLSATSALMRQMFQEMQR